MTYDTCCSSFGESGSETAFIEDNGMAERAAMLMGTDPEGLKAALVNKTVEAAGESILGSNNMEQVQSHALSPIPPAPALTRLTGKKSPRCSGQGAVRQAPIPAIDNFNIFTCTTSYSSG